MEFLKLAWFPEMLLEGAGKNLSSFLDKKGRRVINFGRSEYLVLDPKSYEKQLP